MSQKETFYITTQFITQVGSYILGIHIQQSRDAMARYKRLMGFDVFYLTGVDEHGQKLKKALS